MRGLLKSTYNSLCIAGDGILQIGCGMTKERKNVHPVAVIGPHIRDAPAGHVSLRVWSSLSMTQYTRRAAAV